MAMFRLILSDGTGGKTKIEIENTITNKKCKGEVDTSKKDVLGLIRLGGGGLKGVYSVLKDDIAALLTDLRQAKHDQKLQDFCDMVEGCINEAGGLGERD